MGVIHDVTQGIINWFRHEPVIIIAEDHADKLICSICGKQYPARGKYDIGICRECEKIEAQKNASLIGGPFDGQKASDTE